MPAVKLVAPKDGIPLTLAGDTLSIKLEGADTGGASAVLEETSPPQGGLPVHTHSREHELFYVIEGEYEFHVGGKQIRLTTGCYLFGPKGIPHGFKNVGSKPGRLLITFLPAGAEKYFEEVGKDGPQGPWTMDQIVARGKHYGIDIQV